MDLDDDISFDSSKSKGTHAIGGGNNKNSSKNLVDKIKQFDSGINSYKTKKQTSNDSEQREHEIYDNLFSKDKKSSSQPSKSLMVFRKSSTMVMKKKKPKEIKIKPARQPESVN